MGVYLESEELRKVNEKYWDRRILIEDLRKKNEPNPFIICNVCKGTGLDEVNYHEHGASWSGNFCSKCRGRGMFDVFEDILEGRGLLSEKQEKK